MTAKFYNYRLPHLLALAALMISAAAWSGSALALHPEAYLDQSFLFRDAAHVLVVGDDLLNGRLLYRDVFYQYGPIPAYLYAATSAVFGNSAGTLLRFQLVLSGLVAALSFQLLRRVLPLLQAFAFSVIALFPLLLLPGSKLADFPGLDYVSIERLLLLAVALVWRPPAARDWRYAVMQGCILGSMQAVKFGGAFVAGAALLLVDLLCSKEIIASRTSRSSWLRTNVTLLATFLTFELVQVACAFHFLPAAIARDVLWPQYLTDAYQSYIGPGERWPRWLNLGYFIAAQLGPLASLILAAGGIGFWFRRRRDSDVDAAGGFVFLALFFLVGGAIYFRHVWHFYQYSWSIALAAACAFTRLSNRWRLSLVLLWLPAFLTTVRGIIAPANVAGLERSSFAHGENLWLDAATTARVHTLETLARSWNPTEQPKRPAVFFPDAAGFHHFFELPHAGRFFYFSGGLIQPHDETKFIADTAEAKAIVVFFNASHAVAPPPMPAEWAREFFVTPMFRPNVNNALAPLLAAPTEVDEHCWVFPLRDQPAR